RPMRAARSWITTRESKRSRRAWSVVRRALSVRRGAWSVERRAWSVGRTLLFLITLYAFYAQRSTLYAQRLEDTTAFYKALELESAGKYKDAAPLFRTALNTSSAVSAL